MKLKKEDDIITWKCLKCGTEEFVPESMDKILTGMTCPSHICNFKSKMERIE